MKLKLPGTGGYTPDKELEKRLKQSARVKMTKEEVRAQKISYVFWNLPEGHSLTLADVEKIVDEGVADTPADLPEGA